MGVAGSADRPIGEPRGALRLNADLVITAWARTLEHIVGWTAAEAIGRRLDELLPALDGQRHHRLRQLREIGCWQGVAVWRDKRGRPVPIEGVCIAKRDAAGRATSYRVMVRALPKSDTRTIRQTPQENRSNSDNPGRQPGPRLPARQLDSPRLGATVRHRMSIMVAAPQYSLDDLLAAVDRDQALTARDRPKVKQALERAAADVDRPRNPREAFGARLRAARQAAGLSQEQLADRLKLAPNDIKRWEHAGTRRWGRMPAMHVRRRLAAELDVDVAHLTPELEAWEEDE